MYSVAVTREDERSRIGKTWVEYGPFQDLASAQFYSARINAQLGEKLITCGVVRLIEAIPNVWRKLEPPEEFTTASSGVTEMQSEVLKAG